MNVILGSSLSSSIGLVSGVIGVIVTLVAIAGGIAAFLVRKRAASGRVRTSEADVLWQQAQDMRTTLLLDKQKVEEQRDKLMALQTDKVIPALEGTNVILKGLQIVLEDVLTSLSRHAALFNDINQKLDSESTILNQRTALFEEIIRRLKELG